MNRPPWPPRPLLPLHLDAFKAVQYYVDVLIELSDLCDRIAQGGPLPTHEELGKYWLTAGALRRIAAEVDP